MATSTQRILALARRRGVIRPADLVAEGLPREYLTRLAKKRVLERVRRGLYSLPNGDITEHHTLVEISASVPKGVICLVTALRFHGLTTQGPRAVWLALPRSTHLPRDLTAQVERVTLSGRSLTAGIEEHRLEGVPVRVYSAAKTVADCFKFRNRIGLDVAVEALGDFLRKHRGGADELMRQARVDRVHNVIRPYLEAIGTRRSARSTD